MVRPSRVRVRFRVRISRFGVSREHHPTRSKNLQPHTERSGRPGSEPPSVEADVYVCGTIRTPSGACQKRRKSRVMVSRVMRRVST